MEFRAAAQPTLSVAELLRRILHCRADDDDRRQVLTLVEDGGDEGLEVVRAEVDATSATTDFPVRDPVDDALRRLAESPHTGTRLRPDHEHARRRAFEAPGGVLRLVLEEARTRALADGGVAPLEIARRLAQDLASRWEATMRAATLALADCYLADGFAARRQHDEAERLFERAAETAATAGPGVRASVLEIRADLLVDQGRLEAARDLLERAAALRPHEPADRRAETLLRLGTSLLDGGHGPAAAPLLREARGLLGDDAYRPLLLAVLQALAAAEVRLGEAARARALTDEAAPLVVTADDPLREARAAWIDGEALRQLGEDVPAERELERAARRFRRLGRYVDEHEVLVGRVQLLMTAGRSDEIRDLGPRLQELFQIPAVRERLRLSLEALRGDRENPELEALLDALDAVPEPTVH